MSQADDFLKLFENSDRAEVLSAILAERMRQETGEGWDEAHDDEHVNGELAMVAACYATPMATVSQDEAVDVSGGRGETPVWERQKFRVPKLWPPAWHASWWKPKDRERDLVRAAALIMAELERLRRVNREQRHG